MNSKIFGIIVCILLITSYIAIAENTEKTSTKSSFEKLSNASFDADTPIWVVGNTWRYKIDDLTIDYEQEGQYIHVSLLTDKLELKVVNVTTDSYVVEIDAAIKGSGNAYIDLGEGPYNITLNLNNTKLTGTIVFNKSDLGITQLNPKLEGRLVVKINELPNVSIPISIPIPLFGGSINIFTNLSIPLTIINFPLNVSNIWGVPGTSISIDGTIKSPYLNLLDSLNRRVRNHWNLTFLIMILIMEIYGEIYGYTIDEDVLAAIKEAAKTISDILFDILPVINISYVLTNYMQIGNVFETPEIPAILLCESTEDITVQGNSYNAYNISVIGGIGNIYFAPDAGNIVKISGHFKDIIPFVSDLNIELKETNYQP